MFETAQGQNNTNEETVENQNNLHIIKCKEKKIPIIVNEQQEILMQNLVTKIGTKSLVYIILSIIFSILSLSTLIKNNKSYKKMTEYLISNPDTIISETYTDAWTNIGKYEIGILIPNLIFDVIILLFILFLYLKNEKKIHIEINQGILYYSLLIINLLFIAIIYLFDLLIVYLIVYSIFVVAKTPYDFFIIKNGYLELKRDWSNNRVIPVIHIISNYFIVLFSSLTLTHLNSNIKSFLDFDIEENEKMKTAKLCINELYFDIKIKPNYLYLLQLEDNKEKFYQIANLENLFSIEKGANQFLSFKEIFINDFSKKHIHMVLEHPSIVDQLPLVNKGYNYLIYIFIFSFFSLLFISIPSSKIHIINEITYNYLIELFELEEIKPKYYGTFKIYGKFEKKVSLARIIYLSIEICLLFILIIKRLINGGFKKIIFIRMLIFLFILFSLIIFIDIVLSFLVILFSIFFFKTIGEEDFLLANYSVINIKLIFQIIVNIFALICNIICFVYNILNVLYYFDIIKSRKIISENIANTDINKELVIEYISLSNNNEKLNEFRIQGFPKFLFFKHEDHTARNNNNTQNNKIDNIIEVHNTDLNKLTDDVSQNRIKT